MIDYALGILGVSVSIACNFSINGRDVLIPDGHHKSSPKPFSALNHFHGSNGHLIVPPSTVL